MLLADGIWTDWGWGAFTALHHWSYCIGLFQPSSYCHFKPLNGTKIQVCSGESRSVMVHPLSRGLHVGLSSVRSLSRSGFSSPTINSIFQNMLANEWMNEWMNLNADDLKMSLLRRRIPCWHSNFKVSLSERLSMVDFMNRYLTVCAEDQQPPNMCVLKVLEDCRLVWKVKYKVISHFGCFMFIYVVGVFIQRWLTQTNR